VKKNALQLTLHDGIVFASFSGYACCTIVLPLVLTALAQDLGFSLADGNKGLGGFLQMAISIAMVLSMLGCGFLAGRWGKRLSLAWANILLAIGIMATAFAPGYGGVLVTLTLAGIGEGILEGLLTPYLQECHPVEPARYMNIGQAFSPGGMLLMVILAALLPHVGATWRTLVLICGILTLVPGILLLFPRPGVPDRNAADVLDFAKVSFQFRSVVRQARFWWFFLAMFFTGVGEFCITFWIASFLELELHADAMICAFSVGTWCFAMFCGRLGFGAWIREEKIRQSLLVFAGITLLLTPLIPLATQIPSRGIALGSIFILLGLCGVAVAPFWVSVQSYCTLCMPEDDPTMIFILLSCAGIPGCGFAAWCMGILGDQIGLTASFVLTPASYLLMLLLIYFQRIPGKKKAVAKPVRG